MENFRIPFLEFTVASKIEDDESTRKSDFSDFDVYSAAKSQTRRRSSVISYNNFSGFEVSDCENIPPKTNIIEIITNDPNCIEKVNPENKMNNVEIAGKTSKNPDDAVKAILHESTLGIVDNRGRSKSVSRKAFDSYKPKENDKIRRAKSTGPSLNESRGRSEEVSIINNTNGNSKLPVKENNAPPTKTAPLTSEERELLEIKRQLKEEALFKKTAEKQLNRNRAIQPNASQTVVRSAKQLTVPTTPFSHVAQRKGKREPIPIQSFNTATESHVDKGKNHDEHRGPTIPHPFQFRTKARAASKSANIDPPNSVSASSQTVGELLEKFQKDPRSHDVPKLSHQLTQPQSPNFPSRSRAHRRPAPKSTEEVRAEVDLVELKYVFKARTIDPRILHSTGDLGVPKVPPKERTEPCPMKLRTEERSSRRKSEAVSHTAGSSSETAATGGIKPFKALPMPSFANDPRRMKPEVVKKFQPTVAVSPKITRQKRAQSVPPRKEAAMVSSDAFRSHSRPSSPDGNGQKNRTKPTLTEPVEFRFRSDERGLMHKAALYDRLENERKKELADREVHARPVPRFTKAFVPRSSIKDLTEFEEFHLISVRRHREASEAWRKDICNDFRKQIAEREFKAREVPPSTYAASFTVKVSEDRPLVIPLPVELQTDSRMMKRKEYDEMIAEKKRKEEEERERLELLQLEQEKKIVHELRTKSIADGGMVFHAAPILNNDPFPARACAPAPLTEPVTPHLRTATRARTVDLAEPFAM